MERGEYAASKLAWCAVRRSDATLMTRDEFDQYVRTHGGYAITLRLLRSDEGGRQTPLLGGQEYRANWSIDSLDPGQQCGGPIFIDGHALGFGEACTARMVPLFPDEHEFWSNVNVGSRLTAFEGHRAVASAVVTARLPPDPG